MEPHGAEDLSLSLPSGLMQSHHTGYHILGFKAVNIDPEHAEQVALVFALYRELSASLLMGLLALQAAHLGGYSIAINKKDLVRFVVLVSMVRGESKKLFNLFILPYCMCVFRVPGGVQFWQCGGCSRGTYQGIGH